MKSLRDLFGPVDMTTGTPWQKIATFAVPMLIGNIAQQLYNTVDSIVVGRFVGDNALAAVGVAGNIFYLMVVLFIGVGTGSAILVAQHLGAKNREGLTKTIGNCFIVTLIAVILVMIIGTLLARPLLVLLKTPESLIDMGVQYLIIICLGSVGMAYYNIMSGILRGLGDSVSALIYLLVSCALNIVGDILTVAVFGMGVAGVAIATVLAQGISALLCIRKLSKMRDMFDLSIKTIRWDKKYALDIVKLGLPVGLTEAIMSIAMLVTQPLTNSFGEEFIAANTIVMKVDGFAMLPAYSFGTAMTTYTGQNAGAGRIDRIHAGTKQGLILSTVTTTILVALILIFGRNIMSIFTTTTSLVTLAMQLMTILSIGYIATAVMESLNGIMRGCGDAITPMWIGMITMVIFRIPFVYLTCWLSRTPEMPNGNKYLLFISMTICWVFGAVLAAIGFKRGRWKKTLAASAEDNRQDN